MSNGEQGQNQQPPSNGAPPPNGRSVPEEEISLLDILLVVARQKHLIIGAVVIFAVFGVFYALVQPHEYTAEAEVVREIEGEGAGPDLPGGLGGIGGMGINLGGAATGLTAQAFPDVLQGREVRHAVVQDTFYFADEGARMTYVDYANQPPSSMEQVIGTVQDYTIGLPWTLVGALTSDPERPVGEDEAGDPVYPTEEEEEAMEVVGDMVSASVDEETGLMTVSVTAGDPELAASVTDSFVEHLRDRVRDIRTQKARQNLEFIEDRYEEAEAELEAAEDRLAEFLDQNRNIQSARLQNERDRLQRQVSHKSSLYNDLQSQLTQAEINLQRSEPVVTVVEAPAPPMSRSAPQRSLIVLLSLVLGGFLGLGAAFVNAFIQNAEEDDEEREKLDEIREQLIPARWREGRKTEDEGRSLAD